jgi:DNA-binding MarR family transcriptional regulator
MNDDSFFDDIYGSVMLMKRVLLKVHDMPDTGGLSRLQLGALGILSVSTQLPVSELGRRLKISKPQVSLIVGRLEEDGLVKRSVDSLDRRVSCLEITDQGRETLDRNVNEIKAGMKKKLSVLSGAERAELKRSFSSIVEILGKLE